MNTLIALILVVLHYGQHTTGCEAVIYREPEMTPIVFQATATWTELPPRVLVNCRSLYQKPLPICPVRLIAKCRARGTNYIDLWDGYIGLDGVRHGIRIYAPAGINCKLYTNGELYIVDGVCPQAGRIIADTIERAR